MLLLNLLPPNLPLQLNLLLLNLRRPSLLLNPLPPNPPLQLNRLPNLRLHQSSLLLLQPNLLRPSLLLSNQHPLQLNLLQLNPLQINLHPLQPNLLRAINSRSQQSQITQPIGLHNDL